MITGRQYDDLIARANDHVRTIGKIVENWPLALVDRKPYLDRLDMLTGIIEDAELAIEALVMVARTDRTSWREIGERLGTTKQAAQQRFSVTTQSRAVDPQQLTIGDE